MSSFTDALSYEFNGSYEDGRPLYTITKEFTYCFGSLEKPIATFTVPEGFVTDFASIPWPFDLIIHPGGPWAKAAVLHDWLLQNLDNRISDVAIDGIFYEAMRVSGVGPITAFIFFTAVRFYHDFLSHNDVG